MNSRNRKVVLAGLAVVALLAAPAVAQTTVTVEPPPALNWLGYMNVFELPENGGGYVFGNAWGTADLPAVFTGDQLTLSPNTNTYNPADPFWVNPDGSANKVTEANMYVEDTSLIGQTVEFTGFALENSLVAPYTSQAFIKVLDPAQGYAAIEQAYVPLVGGQAFSVSVTVPNTAGLIPQYGFVTVGPIANPDTVDQLGRAVVIPEPMTGVLLALAGAALLRRR